MHIIQASVRCSQRERVRRVMKTMKAQTVASNIANRLRNDCLEVIKKKGHATKGKLVLCRFGRSVKQVLDISTHFSFCRFASKLHTAATIVCTFFKQGQGGGFMACDGYNSLAPLSP